MIQKPHICKHGKYWYITYVHRQVARHEDKLPFSGFGWDLLIGKWAQDMLTELISEGKVRFPVRAI